jgi:hypothetical protein
MERYTVFEGINPARARVPSTVGITPNMLDKKIVDAGASLRRFAKKVWKFDFNSLVKGDAEGVRFQVLFENTPLSFKVYRSDTGEGRHFRLSLDASLVGHTSLSLGDVLLFDTDSDGRAILTINRNSGPLANPSRPGKPAQLSNSKRDPFLVFRTEGEIFRHEAWERTRCKSAAKLVKQLEMQRVGRLRCHGCGIEPLNAYGVDVIEAHHRVPLSELKESRIPNPGDFDLLCPNCHRAIHRLVPPDLVTLRAVLKRQGR